MQNNENITLRLFGSWSKGQGKKFRSDVDVLVVLGGTTNAGFQTGATLPHNPRVMWGLLVNAMLGERLEDDPMIASAQTFRVKSELTRLAIKEFPELAATHHAGWDFHLYIPPNVLSLSPGRSEGDVFSLQIIPGMPALECFHGCILRDEQHRMELTAGLP